MSAQDVYDKRINDMVETNDENIVIRRCRIRIVRSKRTDRVWVRWATRKENEADKRIHGTKTINAKLTRRQVDEIKSLKGEMQQKDIAARYGVSPSQISNIHRGKSWHDDG